MAGRKKLPTELKKAKGTLQKCRTISNEIIFDRIAKLPPAPIWFDAKAKKLWKITAKELADKKLINNLNLPLVIAYCNEMSMYLKFNEDLNGIYTQVIETKTGVKTELDPLAMLAKNSLDRALKIASEFGITPSSASKVSIKVENKKDEMFD